MKKIISGIFVLTCFLPVRLFPADIISGDSVSVTAFSKDERYVAIEISSIDTAVGGNYQPPAWLVLADSYNKNIIQKTLITKEISPDCESDTIAERLRRANKKRKERAYNNLKRKNYAFEVNKFNFAQNIEVKHRILKEDDSNGEAVIYLYHGDTRYSMTVGRVAVSDRPAGGEGFSLRGISASPNEKTLVVSYGEHPVMEFDAGLDGALIINRFNLSYFYNSVGFEYYKKKSYREALSFFENAISCNPKNATAIFNSACMNGLLGEAADSVKNLSQLKRLKTKAARKYLKKVKRDKDFNKIRKTREFEKFMKSI